MGMICRRKYKDADGQVRECETWTIRYSRNGRKFEESTKTTKQKEAERILKLREGDVAKGLPVSPAVHRLTFDDALVDLVTEYTTNGRRSAANVAAMVTNHLKPYFSGWGMMQITTAAVRGYVARRQAAGAKNGTINRELSALKRAFSLAVKGGRPLQVPHIPMLQEDNARKGFF
jgi:hypothetical protein